MCCSACIWDLVAGLLRPRLFLFAVSGTDSFTWTNAKFSMAHGTWHWGGFSGVFAEIGSSWVPYTTFRAVPILASSSRRYSNSKNDSPHHRYGESAIEFFKRKLSVSMIRRVVDSPQQWYGESPTSRIIESKSYRLSVSPIRRVDDSAYHWVGESTLHGSVIQGVAVQRKN